ncbi:MAG: PrsW family glutamic-type intramembrane protease [Pelolinea sp.]|nr:PrsW family glutamic-type intramembrane protease [Pelolinea sp.]
MKKWKLWGVLLAGALIGLAAVAFVQFPLGELFRYGIHRFWDNDQLMANSILIGGISVFIGGLTQEGAKMISVLGYRFIKRKKDFSPFIGLIVGACVGAGFGFIEAQWALNRLFAVGWSWQVVEIYLALAATLLSYITLRLRWKKGAPQEK